MESKILTRHWYRLEEVVEALKYCIFNQKAKEACFWLQELLDSEEAGLAIITMMECWLLGFGMVEGGPAWLLKAKEIITGEVDEQELADLCWVLARTDKEERDATVVVMSVIGGRDRTKPEPPEPLGPSTVITGGGQIVDYMYAACYQGKLRCATWCWPYLPVSQAWYTIRAVAEAKRIDLRPLEALATWYSWVPMEEHPGWTLAIEIAAMMYVCGCSMVRPYAAHRRWGAELDAERTRWLAATGRRSRREYEIPRGCLYFTTERGRTSNLVSNIAEVREPFKWAGCAFWERAIDEGRLIWIPGEGVFEDAYDRGSNGDYWEDFMEKYAPDDIPDEWSAADQEKSHGTGTLSGSAPRIWMGIWLRRWVEGLTRGCWGYLPSFFHVIDDDKSSELCFWDWYNNWLTPNVHEEAVAVGPTIPKPLRRRLVFDIPPPVPSAQPPAGLIRPVASAPPVAALAAVPDMADDLVAALTTKCTISPEVVAASQAEPPKLRVRRVKQVA